MATLSRAAVTIAWTSPNCRLLPNLRPSRVLRHRHPPLLKHGPHHPPGYRLHRPRPRPQKTLRSLSRPSQVNLLLLHPPMHQHPLETMVMTSSAMPRTKTMTKTATMPVTVSLQSTRTRCRLSSLFSLPPRSLCRRRHPRLPLSRSRRQSAPLLETLSRRKTLPSHRPSSQNLLLLPLLPSLRQLPAAYQKVAKSATTCLEHGAVPVARCNSAYRTRATGLG